MTRKLFRSLGIGLAAWIVLSGAQAAVVYSLSENGTTLVRFDSAAPGNVTSVGQLTQNLEGLDFRPADGQLYGYSFSNNTIYRVDTATAALTQVSMPFVTPPPNPPFNGSTTALLGIDFNPVPDRMRLVNADGQNLRINVATGATLQDGTLTYAVGDVNFGQTPGIVDAAYTNSDRNPATGTTLYYIDYLFDMLVSTSNPNGGVLSTVGSLGLDPDDYVGFDIFTSGGSNFAFASLTTNDIPSLYSINLATGAASLIGAIGATDLYGLAVVPGFLPLPGSMSLALAAGFAGVCVVRRRRSGLLSAS